MKNMYGYNLVPIYTQEQIRDRVEELGIEILSEEEFFDLVSE